MKVWRICIQASRSFETITVEGRNSLGSYFYSALDGFCGTRNTFIKKGNLNTILLTFLRRKAVEFDLILRFPNVNWKTLW
jgi:hypothetical protein